MRNIVTKLQWSLSGHDSQIHVIRLSSDGALLASGQKTLIGMAADVIVWDFKGRSQVHRLSIHKGYVASISFSFKSKYLASVGGQDDNQLVIWDLSTGVAISGTAAHTDTVHSCSFYNRDETRLVTCGANHVKNWSLNEVTKKLKVEPIAMGSLKRTFASLVVNADDSLCYCGTYSGDIVEVDLNQCMQKRIGPVKTLFPLGVVSLSLLPQGDLLAGTGDGVIAKIAVTSLRIISDTKVNGSVTSITITPDGTHCFAGTGLSSIYFVETESLKAELRSTCHTGRINAIAFPHNVSEVFATASMSEIRLWNAKSKQELLSIQVPKVECHCLDFGMDGKSIVSGWADGKLRAFTPQTGKLIYAINDAHRDGVTALRAVSDCTRVISGGFHGEIRIWRVSKSHQELIASLKEHRSRIHDIKLRTTDDGRAISASADGSCIVWDLVSKTRQLCLFDSTVFRSLVYHPDFSQIVTVGSDRKITYWDATDGDALRVLEGATDGNELNVVAIARSGSHFVVGGSDGRVKLYEYDEGALVAVGTAHSCAVTACAVSPNQEVVVTGAADGSIVFWQLSGELVETFSLPC